MQKLIQALKNASLLAQLPTAIEEDNIFDWLVEQPSLDAQTLASFVSRIEQLPQVDIQEVKLQDLIKNGIAVKQLFAWQVLVLAQKNNCLTVAIANPDKKKLINELRFHSQCDIDFVIVRYDHLQQTLQQLLRLQQTQSLKDLPRVAIDDENDMSNDDNTPIVAFVNGVIQHAIDHQATDIHFEAYTHYFRIRVRIDGLLQTAHRLPPHLSTAITSRLKIMAKLDISEKRLPQDGHLSFAGQDARISTCPLLYGEKVVVRLLSRQRVMMMEALAFTAKQQRCFIKAITKSQGLVLVTGPTGSGKSNTLYTALSYLNREQVNICSVEDPVEITVDDTNQTAINPKVGLTFSRVLRALLRQDPDVMMIGEIRDQETAQIAIHAAQTGHLVLSTLHTDNSKLAINRLMNLGISIHDIVGSVRLISAQRLVRKLCSHCHGNKLVKQQVQAIKNRPEEQVTTTGCTHCYQGYRGRIAIHELLPIKPISSFSADEQDILHELQQIHVHSLWQQGMRLVKQGITSMSEIQRVTNCS